MRKLQQRVSILANTEKVYYNSSDKLYDEQMLRAHECFLFFQREVTQIIDRVKEFNCISYGPYQMLYKSVFVILFFVCLFQFFALVKGHLFLRLSQPIPQ